MDKAYDIQALKDKCTHSYYNGLESKGPFGKHRLRDNFKVKGKVDYGMDWVNLANDSY